MSLIIDCQLFPCVDYIKKLIKEQMEKLNYMKAFKK